ncbi:MAG: hypothetical protein KatS3mg028_0877 [Bacteroidia bacterium]|nr:MAG: hypothetical protein KatS3mg028_0877 [Bacteroidia bacterium]
MLPITLILCVWKPAGATSPAVFGTHDPNATITHIGGGCKEDVGYILDPQSGQLERYTDEIIENIKSVVDFIQNQPAGPNDFYTMNMLINFRDIPLIPNFADSIAKIIDGIQPYVNQGKIIWATLSEKYNMWYAQHTNPNDYFNYDCANIPLSVNTEIFKEEFHAYPNPSTNQITFETNGTTDENHMLNIYNSTGQIVTSKPFQNKTIANVNDFSKGLYFYQIQSSSGKELIGQGKFIVQ